eukprot:scaffold2159_cov69-Skeletonema_marinoi.AAC.3
MNSVQSGPESSCLRWVGRVGVCVVGSRRRIKVGEFLLSEALRNDGEILSVSKTSGSHLDELAKQPIAALVLGVGANGFLQITVGAVMPYSSSILHSHSAFCILLLRVYLNCEHSLVAYNNNPLYSSLGLQQRGNRGGHKCLPIALLTQNQTSNTTKNTSNMGHLAIISNHTIFREESDYGVGGARFPIVMVHIHM